MTSAMTSTTRLKDQYKATWAKELKDELKLDNINEAPRLEKIVVAAGLGKAKDDKKLLEVASNTIIKITGQRPVETVAKKAVASFKLREGNKVGLKVTLRDRYAYEFLDRLVTVVLPRVRDFHGLSLKSFDNQGNYSIGLPEQSVFPELSFEELSILHGLQITLHIKSRSRDDSEALLRKLGLPFERTKQRKGE